MTEELLRKAALQNFLFSPGEMLQDELAARDMSQAELARRMGRPNQLISELIHARKELTPETALGLEEVLGIPAKHWLRREQDYREVLARRQRRQQLQPDLQRLAQLPPKVVRFLVQEGVLQDADAPEERALKLRQFLAIASLRLMDDLYPANGASPSEAGKLPWAVLLRMVEIRSELQDALPLNRAELGDLMREWETTAHGDLRGATLRSRLAKVGVRLVVAPSVPNTSATPLAIRFAPTRLVVALPSLSDRTSLRLLARSLRSVMNQPGTGIAASPVV